MVMACFIISPMGDEDSETRKRADFVLKTYLEPACKQLGYTAIRSDAQAAVSIAGCITNALQNAPMAIAYLGAPEPSATSSDAHQWNANVMIEVGYRLASGLPLVCVRDASPSRDGLPAIMRDFTVLTLPTTAGDTAEPAARARTEAIIDKIAKQLEAAGHWNIALDSLHPMAAIHASSRNTSDSSSLLYTAASDDANIVFGAEKRLVGRTMPEFMDFVKARMHPVQWKEFERDQNGARRKLAGRMTATDSKAAAARVPIVFEDHDGAEHNLKAYLPIIVQDYSSTQRFDTPWYNLRVLYLNVTTATRKVKNADGDEYYVCDVDPTANVLLEPLPRPINVFLSYSSPDRDAVKPVYEILSTLKPYVKPWMDCADISPAEDWSTRILSALDGAEMYFYFIGTRQGPGQTFELMDAQRRLFGERKYPVLPVMMPGVTTMPSAWGFLSRFEYLPVSALSSDTVKALLQRHYPDRCPQDWGRAAMVS